MKTAAIIVKACAGLVGAIVLAPIVLFCAWLIDRERKW